MSDLYYSNNISKVFLSEVQQVFVFQTGVTSCSALWVSLCSLMPVFTGSTASSTTNLYTNTFTKTTTAGRFPHHSLPMLFTPWMDFSKAVPTTSIHFCSHYTNGPTCVCLCLWTFGQCLSMTVTTECHSPWSRSSMAPPTTPITTCSTTTTMASFLPCGTELGAPLGTPVHWRAVVPFKIYSRKRTPMGQHLMASWTKRNERKGTLLMFIYRCGINVGK